MLGCAVRVRRVGAEAFLRRIFDAVAVAVDRIAAGVICVRQAVPVVVDSVGAEEDRQPHGFEEGVEAGVFGEAGGVVGIGAKEHLSWIRHDVVVAIGAMGVLAVSEAVEVVVDDVGAEWEGRSEKDGEELGAGALRQAVGVVRVGPGEFFGEVAHAVAVRVIERG